MKHRQAWLRVAQACALSLGLASAAPAADAVAEQHRRIAAERQAAQARYAEQERACSQRFIVTSCLDDAKRARRATLLRLRQEQNQLDDAQRAQRARERAAELERRAAEESARRQTTTAREPRQPAAPRPPTPRMPKGSPLLGEEPREGSTGRGLPSGPSLGGKSPQSPAERSALETRSRATFDAAHRAAEAHREMVEERNARHAQKRKPAAALPPPPGASAAR